MKCRDLEELLSAYADGELAQTQREFVEEHLNTCAGCRAALARYREAGERLISLRAVPAGFGIDAAAVLSRIKAVSGRTRRWLRPVLAGASLGIIAIVLAMVFVLSGQSPKDSLANAVARTQSLKAYRFDSVSETRLPAATEWIGIAYHQVEYAGAGAVHVKSRFTPKPSAASPEWVYWETVTSDNIGYLWEMTSPNLLSPDLMNEMWTEEAARVQDPMDSFKLLTSVRRLPDEKVDGVTCLHYTGQVDMDKWIEQQVAIWEEIWREQATQWEKVTGRPWDDSDTANSRRALEALYRTRQIQSDYWIGKEDGLLHQVTSLDTQAAWAHEAMPLSTDYRGTATFYDFNENIVIKPPLDDQGNLLEGWRIQGK